MNMDYKYIEQLLEQYWQCETSLEEEEILRSFFRQEELPAHLLPYKNLFVYEQMQAEIGLGDDFDAKILSQIEKPVVKARKLTLRSRMLPLFKAAAVVVAVLSMGTVAQHSFFAEDNLDYNYDTYTDTYNDPQMAYEEVSSALMRVSERMNQLHSKHGADSLAKEAPDVEKSIE